jgi:pimeloyl-ACP methyl ester carboxylesterase
VIERHDVRAWADRVFKEPAVRELYGFGFSMGAAVLLQSLDVEPRLRGAIAEAPFSSFADIAYDRVASMFGMGPGTARTLFFAIVEPGFLYGRARYGIDLEEADPSDAIARAHVPILLIHGDRDRNIGIHHSRALQRRNPQYVRSWEVSGARHVQVRAVAGEEYERRVVEFLAAAALSGGFAPSGAQ